MKLVVNGMGERQLRKEFYALLEGLDADSKKKAYWRAKQTALDAHQIEVAPPEGGLSRASCPGTNVPLSRPGAVR